MKRLFVFLISATMLASCGQKQDECKALTDENAELKQAAENRDKQVEEITATVNDVESNLEAIQRNQSSVDSTRRTKGANQKEKITYLIADINTYVAANKEKVDALETSIAKSKTKSAGLMRLVARLRKNLMRKEAQIDSLKSSVESLTGKIGDLESNIATKESELANKSAELATSKSSDEAKDTELNTGYYIVGDKKLLTTAGVITKKGGVLGVGKVETLNGGLDKSKFTAVNIRNITEVDLGNSKKPMVISTHPGGSYTIIKDGGRVYLKITDYQRFWSTSKFLVVEQN